MIDLLWSDLLERGRARPLAAPSVQDCEYILLAFQAKPKRDWTGSLVAKVVKTFGL